MSNNFNFEPNQKRESKTNPESVSFGIKASTNHAKNRATAGFKTSSRHESKSPSGSVTSSRDSGSSNRKSNEMDHQSETGTMSSLKHPLQPVQEENSVEESLRNSSLSDTKRENQSAVG